MNFDRLVEILAQAHGALEARAAKAVNVSLTLRNWLFGYHIREYEQSGADRGAYGERLLETLAQRLQQTGLKRMEARELRRYRQFYLTYPQIRETLSTQLPGLQIRETTSPESGSAVPTVPAQILLEQLSFSHFAELLQLDDPTQRAFYEAEALRSHWSVRELKRQIATQYYQRSGLSRDPAVLSALAHRQAEAVTPQQVIRDPYVFEFLGLKPQEVVTEGQLEDALLDRLQAFLLELGHGFCFEARQQRLVIGGEHFFVDLVFYHRVLKCHVLIELKNDAFKHEHLGQLNAYVSYYQQHQMTEGDQPPIGILLCTRKNQELVEYALAGMSNQLFVSRYQVQLPDKAQMAAFLHQAIAELGGDPTGAGTG
ncbi:YhcG family protein [Ideonella sp. B508-1]|uniref:PDDEXK nuclease domain-containing protein n=1 Tax=Ideonella sp. B508-1 TaxID=137716 RepID=UPI00034DD1C6|nr:PDDEXK nuclease domain-containing protein [Ideonella sp. B508-1]